MSGAQQRRRRPGGNGVRDMPTKGVGSGRRKTIPTNEGARERPTEVSNKREENEINRGTNGRAEARLSKSEVEELRSKLDEIKQENEALERENLTLKYSLPPAIAVGLKGESRQEREAHARSLRAYLNRSGVAVE